MADRDAYTEDAGGRARAGLSTLLAAAQDVSAAVDRVAEHARTLGFVAVAGRIEPDPGLPWFDTLSGPAAVLFRDAGFRQSWPMELAAVAEGRPIAWTLDTWPGRRTAPAREAMHLVGEAGLEAGLTVADRRGWGRVLMLTGFCTAATLNEMDELETDLFAAAASRLHRRLEELTPQRADPGLTRRELEVLRLTAQGLTGEALGRRLGVTEAAVKFHLANVRRKLNVRKTAQAVARLNELGGLDS